MFNEHQISTVRDSLVDRAKTTRTVLGAQIGDIVKKDFPEENIRKSYGSVQNFVKTNFADLLSFTGRYGIDNIYTFDSSVCNTPEISGPQSDNLIDLSEKENFLNSNDAKSATRKSVVTDVLLRRAIKEAVDLMTEEQLRQLSIPAGILLDAISKTARF